MPINFEDPDIQGALRSKNPVMVGNVPVMHVPFSRITSPDLGYNDFNKMVSLLCISEEQYKDKILTDNPLDPLTMLCALALNDKKTREILERACQLFFGKKPTIDEENVGLIFYSESLLKCPNCYAIIEKKLSNCNCPECNEKLVKSVSFEINHENFNDVVSVIKKRIGASSAEDDDYGNPANETARRLIARRNDLRKKRAKALINKSGISIWEMVDIFASISKMTYSEVMEFDIFQLKTQIERYKLLDNYEIGIQSLLHGAKKSDVNLKHWIGKIESNDEDNDNDDE